MSDFIDNVAKQLEKKPLNWALVQNKTKKQNTRKTARYQTTKPKADGATGKAKKWKETIRMKLLGTSKLR